MKIIINRKMILVVNFIGACRKGKAYLWVWWCVDALTDWGVRMSDGERSHGVSFAEAVRVWTKIGLASFGGPAGQIAVMHRVLVEEKRWVSEQRFLHALNFCMLLPGPEAQQLATYVGWLLHGVRGGLLAGGLFILPGFVSILALSVVYVVFAGAGVVAGIFLGLKAAVLAVVIEAVVRIGRRVLKNAVMVGIAASSFVGIFGFAVPFPWIILGAALVGFLGDRWRPDLFRVAKHAPAQPAWDAQQHSPALTVAQHLDAHPPAHAVPSKGGALRVLLVAGGLWALPVVGLWVVLGGAHVLTQESIFFSKTAVITFGGAYAVLAFIAQEAVERFSWLRPGEMMDGLGMAETTPGPLIMVVQFVGFMGAYRAAAPFDPLVAGVLGSIVTAWVTFAPCFLWIFLGAPFMEALRGKAWLNAALSAITAAVVGVILNLAIWFGLHTLFHDINTEQIGALRLFVPVWGSVDWAAVGLSAGALVAAFVLKLNMFWTLGGAVLAGVLLWLLG